MGDARDREDALDALREQARQGGAVAHAGVAIESAPFPPNGPPSYYGQPLLKAPVWTWEIPAYFVVGGIAGMAAMLAAVASLAGLESGLAADARWVALAGALLSPCLLISDLGRPARFLNMLRIFKPQSPMSVGAWTLIAFSGVVGGSLAARIAIEEAPAVFLMFDVLGAVLGLVLATYTGVLLGVSVVPVWVAHAARLPLLFAASSLGAAVSVLELLGHMTPGMNRLGLAAAVAELGVVLAIRLSSREERSMPLRRGRAGWMLAAADIVGGVTPIVLRAFLADDPLARVLAATATIGGSVILRYGWMAAGGEGGGQVLDRSMANERASVV